MKIKIFQTILAIISLTSHCISVKIWFTTSKPGLDIYYNKLYIRLASGIVERPYSPLGGQMPTQEKKKRLKILGNYEMIGKSKKHKAMPSRPLPRNRFFQQQSKLKQKQVPKLSDPFQLCLTPLPLAKYFVQNCRYQTSS